MRKPDHNEITQLDASTALAEWQRLRHLDPEIRIERLVSEFFLPPLEMDLRYQDMLRAVSIAMEEPERRPIDWTIARDLAGALALNFGGVAVLGIIGWQIFRP